MARQRQRLDPDFEIAIDGLTHDGRGVGRRDGKAVFVAGALPGERVRAKQTAKNRHFDEAAAFEVLEASADRVAPRCAHFGTCGGCVLQHLDEARQIEAKDRVLTENMARIGHVEPREWFTPIRDAQWGYRRKGRLSVRWVEKKAKALVGFREQDPRFVADLTECHTVIPAVGQRIPALSALVESLEGRRTIPQIEFIAGDGALDGGEMAIDGGRESGVLALVFRHLEPLSAGDREKLADFAKREAVAVFLQPGGIDTVAPLWPEHVDLHFDLSAADVGAAEGVRLQFRPLDFIQVNAGLNRQMIARALDLLDLKPGERVLDLFCGLGNFTLPIARRGFDVVGVEGDAGLVARARQNAEANGLPNVRFFAADLAKDLSGEPWMRDGFDKLLIDPPRAGAAEVLAQLPLKAIPRIVYVSCHPGSLARDAGFLVKERGYTLLGAGVMDMFPHTAHVESIAVFERR
ncbi:23S rRNA (uracil(1939)-C(5))-methyltransferase RlmD [Silanimonas sp.]|uniref:23S rRNA (uracil(1939)-C(5))-methyltransferase RlmD n=1 Tax=Silanimonas sp. TaxID=1929290 RepID=UPI0022C86E5B|nr:23S rRNA (uracil(1939)-C(5))-methyltransferase RlmD [Silanimonas sp.]MCZ8115102.1 23S rRNA (uracil(1939)-C(5))-methyltransferase RlmD [Silanimonas sp.]